MLFQCSKSINPGQRESAFRVFSSIPKIVEKEHVEVLKEIFQFGLQDENIKVK